MRSLCLLAALCSPLAYAQVVTVEANSLVRLPGNTSVLQLERLDVADHGTLLVPAGITRLSVGELHLGREARIAIVPSEQSFELRAGRADLGSGSQITARGAPGSYHKAPLPGRNLNLRIDALSGPLLSVDARGGTGIPGYVGLDGANGEEPGCTWGQAGRGADGDNGGDGRPGAPGAQVRVELPRDYPAEQIKVQVEGGAGGAAG
ncbi:collagen-like protein, partial [Pseudomonas gingeri]